jgi:hypothetical protein
MNHPALTPELQRLINEPLNEPPARARQHWKSLDKAMEKLNDARAQQARYGAEIARLREELALAKQRDQEALGEALAAGTPEPEPTATAIEAEIERSMQREAAMNGVILEAQRRVVELILREKPEWTADLQRHLGDAAALYRTKIVELEQARQNLVEEIRLAGYLSVFPATGGQIMTHQLPGDPDTAHAGPAFAEVLTALIRDSEQLPLRSPVQPSREFLRTLDRKQIVLERDDAEGISHPVVLGGDTHAAWEARDWVKSRLRT